MSFLFLLLQYFKDYKLAGEDVEKYRGYFLSSLGFASQIPSVAMNLVNTFVHCGGGSGKGSCGLSARIAWSLVIMLTVFIFTIILAMVDSSQCKLSFHSFDTTTIIVCSTDTCSSSLHTYLLQSLLFNLSVTSAL